MGSGTFLYRITDNDEVTYTVDKTLVYYLLAMENGWPEAQRRTIRIEVAYIKDWEPYE